MKQASLFSEDHTGTPEAEGTYESAKKLTFHAAITISTI